MENKITKPRKSRSSASYSGRGTQKFTHEQINFVVFWAIKGHSLRKLADEFYNTFNIRLSHPTFKSISKAPHKYEIGYKKPKTEYKSHKTIVNV